MTGRLVLCSFGTGNPELLPVRTVNLLSEATMALLPERCVLEHGQTNELDCVCPMLTSLKVGEGETQQLAYLGGLVQCSHLLPSLPLPLVLLLLLLLHHSPIEVEHLHLPHKHVISQLLQDLVGPLLTVMKEMHNVDVCCPTLELVLLEQAPETGCSLKSDSGTFSQNKICVYRPVKLKKKYVYMGKSSDFITGV